MNALEKIVKSNRCRVDVYAPSVSRFTTMASGDISIPKGLKTQRNPNPSAIDVSGSK